MTELFPYCCLTTSDEYQNIILVLKLTLVVEIQALLLCCPPPLLEHSLRLLLPVQLS